MATPFSLINPKGPPRMRTAVDRLVLREGECSLIQNARTDGGVMMTRISDLAINASPPAGAKTSAGSYFPRGDCQAFIQGTAYWISAWDMTAGGTAIFSQNLSTGAYTEITNAGGSPATTYGGDTTGKTRFATQANVAYSQVATPRRVLAGVVVPPVDQLVIQNGEDDPIMWNPGGIYSALASVMWATPIVIPPNANVYNPICTSSAFWQVMGNTKTYYANAGPPRVNQSNFQMVDSTITYGAADATKRVPRINLGTATNQGDIATIQFPSGSGSFYGPYMYIVFEGSQSTISNIFKDSALEVNRDNVGYASISSAWDTLYDPSSSDPRLNHLPDMIPFDTGNTRTVMAFPLRSITSSANRTLYHLRLRRVNANDVGTTQTMLIIAIYGTGLGGGMPFGIEWSIDYTDHYATVESPPIVQGATIMDKLVNIGGPFAPDASPNSPILLAQDTRLFYDWHHPVANSIFNSGSSFTGGLNGQPSHVDFYFRIPGSQTNPLYFSSGEMWYPDAVVANGWNNIGGAATTVTYKTEIAGTSHAVGIGYGIFANIDFQSQDPGVPCPNDFHIPMPRAAVVMTAANRLFCGRTKTSSGSREKGRLVFSDRGFFNRFRSEPDITDSFTGSFVFFEGEQIQGMRVGSAVAQGSVSISIWTDRSYYRLGQSGGETLIGSGFDGNLLSYAYRVSSDGTNMPYSIAQWNNSFFWVNVDGHVIKDNNGSLANISIGEVTNSQGLTSGGILDIIADVPSARRASAVAVFARHRLYLFLTPTGGTSNTRVAIWSDDRGMWESLDTITSCEWVATVYDSSQNGGGQRVLVHGTNGASYGYEEGSSTVAFRVVGRGIVGAELDQMTPGGTFTVKEIELFMDTDAGRSVVVSWYRNFDSSSVDFTLLADAIAGNWQWLLQGSLGSGQTQVESWGGYMDVAATLSGGKKIRSLVGYLEGEFNEGRGYTA